MPCCFFFFSSRRRHRRCSRDWSSDVCSSDLEGVAAEQDRATFRIIGNDALLAVARALPRAPAELRGIAALPPSLATRHGPALLDGVQRALALAESEIGRASCRERV